MVIVVVSKGAERQADLPELADALGTLGFRTALGQGGQQQCGQNTDDGDNAEQLDERKGALPHGITRRLVDMPELQSAWNRPARDNCCTEPSARQRLPCFPCRSGDQATGVFVQSCSNPR